MIKKLFDYRIKVNDNGKQINYQLFKQSKKKIRRKLLIDRKKEKSKGNLLYN